MSNTFRRHSLVLDPAAFDSTPSLDLLPQEPLPSRALRLRRSADTLKEFGKQVMPRLRLGRRNDKPEISFANGFNTAADDYVLSQPPSTTPSHTSTRTRSNTIESTRSSRSVRSKRSSGQLNLPAFWSHEHKFAPLHNSSQEPYGADTHSGSREPDFETEQYLPASLMYGDVHLRCGSPKDYAGSLPPLAESGRLMAPVISESIPDVSCAYDVTDPLLEEILKQMQDDDEAFLQTEAKMRKSGWSSEHDIEEVKTRRQENRNLWQRRLENALDSLKATNHSE